jgi:hypothetical protein
MQLACGTARTRRRRANEVDAGRDRATPEEEGVQSKSTRDEQKNAVEMKTSPA